MGEPFYDPYCGPAPVPAELWTRWNFDSWLFVGLGLLTMAWLAWGRRDRVGRLAFSGAMAILLLAFVSPLCALSAALFSARILHHVLLVAGAAPLLALALPLPRLPQLPLSVLVVVSTLVLWVWHAPGPYAYALSAHGPYWLMQITLSVSAWLFWRGVLAPKTPAFPALLALLAAVMQMGLLGALLVFAPTPVFAPHFATTIAFGLTALEDQQLAGLLMWVPSVLPYLGLALALSARLVGGRPGAEPAR